MLRPDPNRPRRLTPRRNAFRLALVMAAFLAVTTAPTQSASAAQQSYTFGRVFGVAEVGNQQGLAYGGGYVWVCLDTGNGLGRIVKYSLAGTVVKRSPNLPLGHCAEIAYRSKDGTIHAVDYSKGATTARLRVVDMSLARPAVVKTIDITKYGLAGMVAIDNARDQLVVFGGRNPYRFNYLALSGWKATTTVRWLRQFTYRAPFGIPNGLEVVGNEMLFSASVPVDGYIRYNRIHVFAIWGTYKRYIHVPIARESQGLAITPTKNLYLGFHTPQSVYRMGPAYAPLP